MATCFTIVLPYIFDPKIRPLLNKDVARATRQSYQYMGCGLYVCRKPAAKSRGKKK